MPQSKIEKSARAHWMPRLMGTVLVAASLAAGAAIIIKFDPHLVSQAHAAETSPWALLSGERPTLSLDKTSFADQPAENYAYGHTNGSRNDWVQSGSLALVSPNITLMITRQTQPKPIRYSVVRNLEELSELKLVQHSYRPMYYAMDTRFGELRGVIFDVNADGVKKRCVGFHKPVSNKIFVKGFVCARDQAEVTPQKVACLIDRVRYADPETDNAVKASLAPGEAKDCAATLLDPTEAAGDKGAKESL